MNKDNEAKDFKQLGFEDKDLIMFTITNMELKKKVEQVHMVINLKRKIQTEMLTTYLPTLLLLITTYATTFFKPMYFEATVTVNLTIMLVMTTIFTSKIQELPPTSDTKMIDIWLIFCLLVPFAFTLVQTATECYKEDNNERPLETWAEERKSEQVTLENLEYFLKNLIQTAQEGEEGNCREEVIKVTPVGAKKDFQEVKVQRSSFDMLQILQWAGW